MFEVRPAWKFRASGSAALHSTLQQSKRHKIIILPRKPTGLRAAPMNPGTIALIISILVAVFGAGMLTRILHMTGQAAVRADRQQRTEDEVKKHGEEIKQNALNHALLEQLVEGIMSRLNKLDLIDGIAADARFTRESIVIINSQLIPRREVESVIEGLERRVDNLEHSRKQLATSP